MASLETSNEPSTDNEDKIGIFSLAKKFGEMVGCFFFGYVIGYSNYSTWWLTAAAFVWVYREKYRLKHQRKVNLARAIATDEKMIRQAIKDLPGWVLFPDVERAEWLNKILKQMWPFVGEYIKNVLKTRVEPNIDEVMPDYCKGFRFEKIDLGTIPLRIGSIKCYDENTARDEIILDLELVYAGNCDIQIKVKGLSAGIKHFQLYGIARVELKPLIKDIPLIACVSVYFLKNPVIEFNFTNLADILDFPGLSEFLRKAIKEQISKLMVLPNKYVYPMVPDFRTHLIKRIQPMGVLRLEVIEARQLKKADVGMLGMGKSDPYVNIIIGNQEFRTATIQNTINPRWNFICETLAFFSMQSIDLEVMDEDQGSKDDFLGRVSFPIDTVVKERVVDAWINLKDTKTGKIHIKATWIAIEHSTENLNQQLQESKEIRTKYRDESQTNCSFGSVTCLLVYLDCAKNLPMSVKSIGEPSPQVIFKLGKNVQKSIIKNFTSNPIWEENFSFMMKDFNPHEELTVEMVDVKNNERIGNTSIRLQSLLELKDMTHTEPLVVRKFNHNFDLCTEISLWFLNAPSASSKVKMVRDESISGSQQNVDNIPTMEDMVKGTVEPFAKMSGIDRDVIEMSQEKRQKDYSNGGKSASEIGLNSVESPMISKRSNSLSMIPGEETDVPMLEITINKLIEDEKLEIIVHKARNLPKVHDKYPDPYVKLVTQPEKKDKLKSVTIKNTSNPIFEESFYLDANDQIESIKFLVLSRSNNSSIFKKSKNKLGYVDIFFNDDQPSKLSFTKWYELIREEDD